MRRCRALLGTYVEIMMPDDYVSIEMDDAFNEAFEEIQLVGELMSFHNPKSDLSQINHHAYQVDVIVHPYTYEVLSISKDLFMDTWGAFDCSIAPELQGWGLLPKTYSLKPECRGNLGDLELKPCHRISFKNPLCLDLGGIAKGYAVDKAIKIIKRYGIHEAVVNAGGDMRVLGDRAEQIYIKHPNSPKHLVDMGQLSNGSIATSAIYYSKEDSVDQKHAALVFPKAKQSILNNRSYSVLAERCVIADGLTKALAIHQDLHAPYFKKYQASGVIL